MQYEFVHGDQVTAGELAARRIKALILPGQRVMRPPVAEAIRKFVTAGGTVIADILPAESNGLKRYDKRLLDDLFADPAGLKGKMPPGSADDVTAWKTHVKAVEKGRSILFGGCHNYTSPPSVEITLRKKDKNVIIHLANIQKACRGQINLSEKS